MYKLRQSRSMEGVIAVHLVKNYLKLYQSKLNTYLRNDGYTLEDLVDKFDQNNDAFLEVDEVRLLFMCVIKL